MRLRADVSLVETEYGRVLLDGKTGIYWELNPMGGFVLSELISGSDTEAVSSRLTQEFEVETGQARSDVEALVVALVEARLVDR